LRYYLIDYVSGEQRGKEFNKDKFIKQMIPCAKNEAHMLLVTPEAGFLDLAKELEIPISITRPEFLKYFKKDLTVAQIKLLGRFWGSHTNWSDAYDKLLYELESFDTKNRVLDFLEKYREIMLNFHLKFYVKDQVLKLKDVPHLVDRYKNEIYFDQLRLNVFLVEGIRDPVVMCAKCGWAINGKHRWIYSIKTKKKTIKAKYIISPACATCSGLVQR